jgi:hypothetical protein
MSAPPVEHQIKAADASADVLGLLAALERGAGG